MISREVALRPIGARIALALLMTCLPLLMTSCDFVVDVLVHNRSGVAVMVDINDRGKPGLVEPGRDAQFGTAINENLKKVRITTRTDASVDIVKEFTRARGYHVVIIVIGPPLEAAV